MLFEYVINCAFVARKEKANTKKKIEAEIAERSGLQSAFVNRVNISSTDSWKPPIHVSDWLISCCGNLILHQKKK